MFIRTVAFWVVGLVAASSVDAGVISFWKFAEGTAGLAASGANSILDSSANNLHMTPVVGSPIYKSVSNPGSTLGLEFSNDLISRPDNAAYKLKNLTIEAFVDFSNIAGSSLRQIVFRGDSRGGRDPFYLGVLGGKLLFNISDLTLDRQLLAPSLLPTGRFVHVAATLDDATDMMKIYVDGSLVASRTAGGMRPNVSLFSNARISIGGLDDGFSKGQFFTGTIDEVRISDVALGSGGFLNAAPVPEPSTLTLLGMGVVSLLCYGWRRRET